MNNRLQRFVFSFGGILALLAPAALHAQDSVVLIGGAGSSGSNGSSNPATLSDNNTVARARYQFHLDVPNSRLVLTVENTSPVVTGIACPVLSDVYFNAPSAITGISIASQTGSGNATPVWTIAFDADLATIPNPNAVNAFGAFSVQLVTPAGGVQNAISNPAADTLGVPVGTNVVGPVTFVLDLVGNLTGLTAFSFTSLLSATPPGNPQVAAARFQSGCGGSSGWVGPGEGCPFAAVTTSLGGGCGGATLACPPGVMGQLVTVTITNAPPSTTVKLFSSPGIGSPVVFRGCTIYFHLSQLFHIATLTTDLTGSGTVQVQAPSLAQSPTCCGYELVVQGVMIDQTAPAGARLRLTNALQMTLGN